MPLMYIDIDIATFYGKLIEIELHKPLNNPPLTQKTLLEAKFLVE